jgi:hypothetical protein
MPESDINSSTDTSKLPKNIPINEIIDLIEVHGLNQAQAAKMLDCDKSNISNRLKAIGFVPSYLKKFKERKADIWASYSKILLNAITTDDLQKAGLSQKVTGAAICDDKERLARGQVTDIIGTVDMVKAQEIVKQRMKTFEEKYGLTDVSINNEGDK